MVAGAVALVLFAGAVLGATAIFNQSDPNDGDADPVGAADSASPYGCRDIDAPWDPDACNYDPLAPLPPEEVPPGFVQREIWLVDRKTLTLSPATRLVPECCDRYNALRALLRGPDPAEAQAGLVTAIPPRTGVGVNIPVVDGIARVDLTSEFLREKSGWPMHLRHAQIVFTLTQFPRVDRVVVLVEGEPSLGGTDPVGRDDFAEVAPPI